MDRTRIIRLTVAATAALLVLAACSGASPQPEPLADPGNDIPEVAAATPTPSPKPSPSSTTANKASKDGAVGGDLGKVDAATEQEAKAFTLQFMKAYDNVWLTGETDQLEAMYTDKCDRCFSEMKYLEQVYGSGSRIQGGTYIDPRPAVKGRDGDAVMMVVPTGISAYQVLNASGLPIKSGEAQETSETYLVTKTSGGWRVVRWEFLR